MLTQIVPLFIQMYIYMLEHDAQWGPGQLWTFWRRDKSLTPAWI